MKKTGHKLVEPAVCPACSKQFHCSTSSKCWCYEIHIQEDVLQIIQEKYESCLCPECLTKISQDPHCLA